MLAANPASRLLQTIVSSTGQTMRHGVGKEQDHLETPAHSQYQVEEERNHQPELAAVRGS